MGQPSKRPRSLETSGPQVSCPSSAASVPADRAVTTYEGVPQFHSMKNWIPNPTPILDWDEIYLPPVALRGGRDRPSSVRRDRSSL
jgi:hypothetical protein